MVGPQQTGRWLVAWDVMTQKERWRVQGGGSIGGGTLATASNLVFQTLGNGRLRALSADKGEVSGKSPPGQTGGMGPPITFHAGRQTIYRRCRRSGTGSRRRPRRPTAGARAACSAEFCRDSMSTCWMATRRIQLPLRQTPPAAPVAPRKRPVEKGPDPSDPFFEKGSDGSGPFLQLWNVTDLFGNPGFSIMICDKL